MITIYWIGLVEYKPLVVCIEPNLFKHKKGRVRLQDAHKYVLSNQRTKPGSEAKASFRREPHLETQATEILFKDAPPSTLTIILFVLFMLSTSQ